MTMATIEQVQDYIISQCGTEHLAGISARVAAHAIYKGFTGRALVYTLVVVNWEVQQEAKRFDTVKQNALYELLTDWALEIIDNKKDSR